MLRAQQAKPSAKTEDRMVDALTLHDGHEIFAGPDEHEIDRLAADIKRRGLQHPIEILPDGQVVAGRRRLMALNKLGRQRTRCRVRYDLEAAGEGAVMQHLLADNLIRHDLTPLETARTYLRLRELLDDAPAAVAGDKRDLLAEKFGKTGRTLDRYARALQTPRVVQDAFDRGALTLMEINRIASLLPEDREAVAEAIEAGDAPKAALGRFAPAKTRRRAQERPQTNKDAEGVLAAFSRAVAEVIKLSKTGVIGGSPCHVQVIEAASARLQEALTTWSHRE